MTNHKIHDGYCKLSNPLCCAVGSYDGHMKMQPVRIDLSDLKSYKVKKHGRYLILMQKDGTSHNAFYFQYDNADCFVNAMRAIVRTRR